MSIKHTTTVDIGSTRTIPKRIHLTQYDKSLPEIEVTVTKDSTLFDLSGLTAEIRWGKPDGYGCTADGEISDSTVTFAVTQQMCAVAGECNAIIQLSDGDGIAGTGAFKVKIEENPINEETIISDSEIADVEKAIEAGTVAKAQATIATEKASEASTSAGNAKTSEENAKKSETSASTSATSAQTSATSASKSASSAETSASSASSSASSASTSASTATKQATEATTQAGNASKSAESADASATKAEKLVAQVPSIYKFTDTTSLSFTTDTTSITQEYTFDEFFPYADTMYKSMEIELSEDSDDVFYEVTSISASGMTVVYTNKAGTALSVTAKVRIFGFLGE